MVLSRSTYFRVNFFLLRHTSNTTITKMRCFWCVFMRRPLNTVNGDMLARRPLNTVNGDTLARLFFLLGVSNTANRKIKTCGEAVFFALRCLEYFHWKDEIC
jgi:hypothetical protein